MLCSLLWVRFTASLASLFRVLRSSQTSAMECLNVLLLTHKTCLSTHCQQQALIQIPSQDGKCEQRTTHLVWLSVIIQGCSNNQLLQFVSSELSKDKRKNCLEIKTGKNCLTSDKKEPFFWVLQISVWI